MKNIGRGKRITFQERQHIQKLLEQNYSIKEIASLLKRSYNTIVNEINRCEGEPYDAEISHRHALKKSLGKFRSPLSINDRKEIKQLISNNLPIHRIAKTMNIPTYPLKDEIRNGGGYKNYNPYQAHSKSTHFLNEITTIEDLQKHMSIYAYLQKHIQKMKEHVALLEEKISRLAEKECQNKN